MNSEIVKVVNDGDKVNLDFIKKWDILEHCTQVNGDFKIGFVGIIIKNDGALFSFPKHYNIDKKNQNYIEDIKKIVSIITLNNIGSSSFNFKEKSKNEFPIEAYINVLNYYKKYGLYISNVKHEKFGYDGNIDWNKTINKSNKIVKENGIIFFPFVLSKTKEVTVFLSECMSYVLDDASKYREFLEFIIPYKSKNKNKYFENTQYVLNQLYYIQNNYFKDQEKKLIFNLINYFKWRATQKNTVRILTMNFENYWESMINFYLRFNFYDFEDDQIIWGNGKKIDFKKSPKMYVESETIVNREKDKGNNSFKVQFDHIWFDETNKKIYLFDSKYFKDEVKGLNYKQAFYHYFLKCKYPNWKIINGLMLPTSKEYYTKNHIDRLDLDQVKITEHYINLTLVMDFILNKRDDFNV